MNTELVDPVVHAVVYEGHILYPYRATAIKNQRRFTFGRIYPQAYSDAEDGRERWTTTTECLLEAARRDESPLLEVRLRFLHPVRRQVYRSTDDGRFKAVPSLSLGDEAYHSWQEVEEQSVDLPVMAADDSCHVRLNFSFPPRRDREEIRRDGGIVGAVERRRSLISGFAEVKTTELQPGVLKVHVSVCNTTHLSAAVPEDEETLLAQTMTSTHTVLQVRGGRFISLTDPPVAYSALAGACRNDGTWPVLVGRQGQDDTVLSSPIILYDYPEIAPESRGDFFDATEIDELLSLRVMTLTDKEKEEVRSIDAMARRILERAESMTADELIDMHGALREWSDTAASAPPEVAEVGGMPARVGDRVRLRPVRRADAMDLSLAGRTGQIEAIEQDFEGQVYLAVVLDDDPGKDLGMMRQPGHRFFYTPDELELVEVAS